MTVDQIAKLLDAPFQGEGNVEITGGAALEAAGPADLAFAENARSAAAAAASRAGCLIVPEGLDAGAGRTVIIAAKPRNAFARAIKALLPEDRPEPGAHPAAIVSAAADLGEGAAIGPYAVIEDGVVIGRNAIVGAGVWIGRDASLGADCRLDPGVKIYPRSVIGDRCRLHAGACIGANGFGFVFEDGRYEPFPQIGRARLGNDVEIGANACVDRGALGETVLEDGVKLDNLVHIGHNCRLGKHVVIAAQTGLAGGVVVEDYAVMGGQVGVADKARIGKQAILGAQAGIVSNQVVPGGNTYWGTPARIHREHLKNLARVDRLPKLMDEVKRLRERLERLEEER